MNKLIVALSLLCSFTVSSWSQSSEIVGYKRTEDVIYSRKFGTALTFEHIERQDRKSVV